MKLELDNLFPSLVHKWLIIKGWQREEKTPGWGYFKDQHRHEFTIEEAFIYQLRYEVDV